MLFLIYLIYFISFSFILCVDKKFPELKSHSFIGVYGFPQSGSNWMHEILRFTPGVSTIHNACYEKHGAQVDKQCGNNQYSVDIFFFSFSSFSFFF